MVRCHAPPSEEESILFHRIERLVNRQFLITSAALFLVAGAANAGTITITVLGTDNPFYAGQTNLDGTGPATYPGLPLTAGDLLTFSVTGSVSYGGTPTDPPDGACPACGFYQLSTSSLGTGISNVIGPVDALYGVFLSGADPTTLSAPANLNFTGDSGIGLGFSDLSPLLQQVFFIGDGLDGNGSGNVQNFHVPTGATRLYFGMLDGSGWYNNTGSFRVTINDPSFSGSQSSATPEPASMLLIGAGLAFVGLVRRKRSA
jgi:hypothetical protein